MRAHAALRSSVKVSKLATRELGLERSVFLAFLTTELPPCAEEEGEEDDGVERRAGEASLPPFGETVEAEAVDGCRKLDQPSCARLSPSSGDKDGSTLIRQCCWPSRNPTWLSTMGATNAM